jgi:hypothetical protein
MRAALYSYLGGPDWQCRQDGEDDKEEEGDDKKKKKKKKKKITEVGVSNYFTSEYTEHCKFFFS